MNVKNSIAIVPFYCNVCKMPFDIERGGICDRCKKAVCCNCVTKSILSIRVRKYLKKEVVCKLCAKIQQIKQ